MPEYVCGNIMVPFTIMTKNMLVKKMPQKLVKNNSKVKIFFRLFVPSKNNPGIQLEF